MKNFTYNVQPYNRAGFEEILNSLEAGKLAIIDGTDARKEDYHVTIKPTEVVVHSNVEGEDWSKTIVLEANETVHVRGAKLEDRNCLIFWRGPFGKAYYDLQELSNQMDNLFEGEGKRGFGIHVSDDAWLTGWLVKENEEHFDLIQQPTWTGPGEAITGRTPYTLDELHVNESEIFLNNIWFNLIKDAERYTTTYDEEKRTFYVVAKKEDGALVDGDDLPIVTFGAYEEVSYQSPVLAIEGLLPPGQTKPELVYDDGKGRQVAVIKEIFDGSSYHTYVANHGQEQIVDQITLGPAAVYNEQLIAILEHRYKTLNEELPHEVNVKTLELLQQIKDVQAARYQERQAETSAEGYKVTGHDEGMAIKTEIAQVDEGNVADAAVEQ